MADQDIVFTPPRDQHHWLHAITGAVEVTAVLGLSFAAAIAVQSFWTPSLAESLSLLSGGAPDFWIASQAMGVQLAAQYGALVLLVVLIGWLRGRRGPDAYALGRPASAPNIILHGLVLGLIVSIIPASIFVLQDLVPTGQEPPLWAAVRNAEWDLSFWVFMAISSFAIVPVLEEFTWRGYVLGRLTEGFSPGASVLLATLMFSLLHVQYLRAEPVLILTLASLILASLAFAFTTLRTGSLAAAIIAHAILNLPLPTEANIAKVVLGVAALIAFHRSVGRELAIWRRWLWTWKSLAALPALAFTAAIVAAAMMPGALPYLGAALGVALIACVLVKRSAWSTS